jgi:predicted nuclease with RNAse H fold
MYYLGYDPAGEGKFAAAVLSSGSGQLHLTSDKIVSSVAEALVFAKDLDRPPAGAAIDAPLTWATRRSGWRLADLELRRRHPDHRNRVQCTNSLRGSVAVQGPALAMELMEAFPGIVISETHPKLSALQLDIPPCDPAEREPLILHALAIDGKLGTVSDDMLDAVIGSYVAYAACTRPRGWVDLLKQIEDEDLVCPLGKGQSVYYFPLAATAAA